MKNGDGKMEAVLISRPTSDIKLILGSKEAKRPKTSLRASNTPSAEYRTISSRIGDIALKLPNPPPEMRVPTHHTSPNNSDDEEIPATNTIQAFATLSTLLSVRISDISSCLDSIPIFMRTLLLESEIDPSIVSEIATSLSGRQLQAFFTNMADEMNVYYSIKDCKSTVDAENCLESLLPILRARIWIKSSDFVVSERESKIIPVKNSIIGHSILTGEDIILADPTRNAFFSISVDLPLLGGDYSLAILPIKDACGTAIGALICSGFQDPEDGSFCQFPQYHIEVLKIVRILIANSLFRRRKEARIPSKEISNLTSSVLSSVHSTAKAVARIISKSLQRCQEAEVYEFNDSTLEMTKLSDGEVLHREDGGEAYEVGVTAIQNELQKVSLYASSFYSENHYVITAKSLQFSEADSDFISDIAPVLLKSLDCAINADRSGRLEEIAKIEREKDEYATIFLANVGCRGLSTWSEIRRVAQNLFGSQRILISKFDGRNMHFIGTSISCPFESCVSGRAFNSNAITWTKLSDPSGILNRSLYKSLSIQVDSSFAFPMAARGSIEIINPSSDVIDPGAAAFFSSVVWCVVQLLSE